MPTTMRHHLGAAPLLLLLLLVISCRLAAASSGAAGAPGAPDGLPSEHLFPCLEELLPCTAYLKTTKHPSNTCCTAMHRAAAAEMPCMCRLLADPELLATFNVTRDQTFRLPARCSLPVGCRSDGTNHEPVVEAPPPPAHKPSSHLYGSASSGDGFRCGVWRAIASAVLGGIVPVAAVF